MSAHLAAKTMWLGCIRTEIAQLRLYGELKKQYAQTYYEVAKNNRSFREDMRTLLSVLGIGPDTAAAVLAEIVAISYFRSPEKLVKWAGLAPKVKQSGHRKRVTGKIHKGGNKYLRRALTLACIHIYARGDKLHPVYRFIKAKYEEKGSYWLVICAGARKLLTILWYLLKHRRT